MKGKLLYISLVAVLLFSMLTPTHLQPVSAQVPEPESKAPPILEACLPGQPCQDEEGNWYMIQDTGTEVKNSDGTKSVGGPDDFGYTWDDSVAYSWIDVTSGGTEAAISDRRDQVGPIPLPFNFKFYENTYSEIYITGSGYLTFQNGDIDSYPDIPSAAEPNAIISPMAARWDYEGSFPAGRVFYKSGGTEPNRYFIVEWHEVKFPDLDPSTFQAILYENGDIYFQYKDINLVFDMKFYSAISGIEDSQGVDGLLYAKYGWSFSSNSAVKFTRPAPGARLKIIPVSQGLFTKSGKINQLNLTITNIGDMGNDLFNLEVSSLWPTTILDAATLSPLVDTDYDSIMDTGSLAQGQSLNLIVQSTTPINPPVGTTNSITVQATSDLDPNITKTAKIDLAIPAPFAQTYYDLYNGELKLDLIFPEGQSTIDVTSTIQFQIDPIVAETPENNFITIWREESLLGDTWTDNLYYEIADKFGNTIRPKSILKTPISTEFPSYPSSPVVSIAPNGNSMIAWTETRTNYDMNISCVDIWYTILNPSGTIITGPINLTNKTSCATSNWIRLEPSAITASPNNNFMISWDDMKRISGTEYLFLEEVLYSIIQSNGTIVKPPTKINDGVAGSLYYVNSYVSAFNENLFLLTYSKIQVLETSWNGGNYFQVINDLGQIIRPETKTSSPFFYNKLISKQLSNGNILLSSAIIQNDENKITYELLNSTNFNMVNFGLISNPLLSSGIGRLSITRDKDNHGILTWTDNDYKHLYYALIDGNGGITTNPIIFRAAGKGEININYSGGSITTNSWEPEAGLDALVNLSSTIYPSAPGESVGIEVFYTNQGVITATNVKLSLTFDDDLTYDYDTSGITPSISGNTIEWELPNLELLDSNRFLVYLSIPDDAPLGTQYSVSFTLSTDGTDSNPSNSTMDAILFSAKQVFLPLLTK
jgi:hypothetical protein